MTGPVETSTNRTRWDAQLAHGPESGGTPPENYERFFVPAIGAPLAADLIDAAALAPAERVLDVACGTGVVARLAAKGVGATGSVAGVDVNAGMLAVARAVTPPEISIEWYEASAETLPLADESRDVVLCQLGLQFFADRGAALREMRRVLAPGGRLVVNVPGPTPPLFAALEDALGRHVGPETAAFVAAVFSLHDAGELQGLLRDAGFRSVNIASGAKNLRLPAPQDFLWQYVHSTPLAGAWEDLNVDVRAEIEREVLAAWEPFIQDADLVMRVGVHLATAQR